MNKKALLEYALFARKELETQIALSLNKIGIYDDHVSYAHIIGDRTIIEGVSESFDKRVYVLRKRIADEFLKDQKFSTLVEEFAYTWFNRIIAIRFMEVHNYFPHGFRVLTSKDDSYEPEILKNLPYVIDELQLDGEVIQSLKEQNKIEELYRYVLIKQCNALNPIFPELFDKQESYLEYLLPNNLLGQDSVIRKIKIIPDEDFLNDVEVVGWLYQFYNSVKKDKVFASKERVTKESIPAVTQLFTPDWIVRYMTENTLGRMYCDSHLNSESKNEYKYYVESTSNDVNKIKCSAESIKFIEPCCGSGHILVYAFDLLYKFYLEEGYASKDIPALILKNNLYGLDIDKRASQLAKFSLVMKARSCDNRFFNKDRFVSPNVFEIKDSQILYKCDYVNAMENLGFSKMGKSLAIDLITSFKDAKTIGSLLQLRSIDYSPLESDIQKCKTTGTPGIYEQDFYHIGLPLLEDLIMLAKVLSSKYDVMVTNPPYLSENLLDNITKNYLIDKFYCARHDMYSAFMVQSKFFVKEYGYIGMVTQHYFMYLQSFKDLREQFTFNFLSLIDLGPRAFPEISGDVVQTATFTFRNIKNNNKAKFFDLREIGTSKEKELYFLNNKNKYYEKNEADFASYPNHVFAFNCSKKLDEIITSGQTINDLFTPKAGVCTGNDQYFIRYWFEPSFECKKSSNSITQFPKYALFSKGGSGKYFSGNIDYVIKLNDLYNPRLTSKSVRRGDKDVYFRRGISWSQMGGGLNKRFYLIEDCVCGTSSPSIYPKNIKASEQLLYCLAFLNSNVSKNILRILSPTTLSVLSSDIASLPYRYDETYADEVNKLTEENILIAKYGLSLDHFNREFDIKNFLGKGLIKDIFEVLKSERDSKATIIKNNYERIDSIFSSIYDLSNEDNLLFDIESILPEITENYYATTLIHIMVDILMGRYSLATEKLNYFTSDNLDTLADDDGILPIYKFIGIESGLTNEICKLIRTIFGETYYKENVSFIAESLSRRPDEGPEEAINRYLNEQFYFNHLKCYEKRPIYWLLNSGKNGAFKCLISIHRYSKNTLAIVNSKYFLPRTAMYKTEAERLTFQIKSSSDAKQTKLLEKQLREIENSQAELFEYGQILDHLANQYIELNLDDGVANNYKKFQGISLEMNGATIKKDLLYEFGLNSKKKEEE